MTRRKPAYDDCPACLRPMTLLFNSFVCDYCDGTIEQTAPFRAFVVWPRGRTKLNQAYVFPSRDQAFTWARSVDRLDADVREIRMAVEPTWRDSSGTTKGVRLAELLYEVFPDHRFKPAANRAFLA